MSNRELTDKEKEIAEASIERIGAERAWLEFQKKHKDLMLNEGLKLNYERELKRYTAELKEITDALEQGDDTIKVLKDQIESGVPVKEESN